MKKKIKKAGAASSTAGDKLFRVIIILLAVILVFMVSITIARIKTGFSDYAVPYALLEYYEAESMYTGYIRAAEQTSDSAEAAVLMSKADEYKTAMEATRSGMGELSFMADEIDGYFG